MWAANIMNIFQDKLKEFRAADSLNNLQKLKQIETGNLMNIFQEKFKEFGAEDSLNNLQEKLKQIDAGNLMNKMQEKLKETGADSLMINAREKLKGVVLEGEIFGGYFVDWLDKVFPPETRAERLRHGFQVAAAFVLMAVVLRNFYWFCRFCCFCCRCFKVPRICGSCFRCCRGLKMMTCKMMKAPGRNYMMPRHVFESNPRVYFRKLRGKPF